MQKMFLKWIVFGFFTVTIWWFSQKLNSTEKSLEHMTQNIEKNIEHYEKKQLLAWHNIQNHQSFIKSLEWGLDHSVQAPARMFMKNQNIESFVITDTSCKVLLALGSGYHCEKPSGISSISIHNKRIKIQTTFSLSPTHHLSLINFLPEEKSHFFNINLHRIDENKNPTTSMFFSHKNVGISAQSFWIQALHFIPIQPQHIFSSWILLCFVSFFLLFLKQSRKISKARKEEQLFTHWCSDPQSDWVSQDSFLHQCQLSIQKHLERKDAAAIKSARRSSQLEEVIKNYETDKIKQTNEIINLIPYESLSNQIVRTCPPAKEKLSHIQENFLDLQAILKSLNSIAQICHTTLDHWNQGCLERTPRRFFRYLSEQKSITHSDQLEEQISQITKHIQSIQQHTQSSLSFFPKSQQYFKRLQDIFSHWHASTTQSSLASSRDMTCLLKELFPQLEIEGNITSLPRKSFQMQINTLDTLIDHVEPSLQKIIFKEKLNSHNTDWNISFSSEHQLPQWGFERIQKWLSAHGGTCNQVKSVDFTTITIHWQISDSFTIPTSKPNLKKIQTPSVDVNR